MLRARLGLEVMNLEGAHLEQGTIAQPPSRGRERRTRRQGDEEPRKGVAEAREREVMEAGERGEASGTMSRSDSGVLRMSRHRPFAEIILRAGRLWA